MAAAEFNGPAVEAERAAKLFLDGTVVAFRHLSLTVNAKEILCIVGPSGCGKTTFLRCIAGLTDLSAGTIKVHGRPVTGPRTGSRWYFSISACCRGRRSSRMRLSASPSPAPRARGSRIG